MPKLELEEDIISAREPITFTPEKIEDITIRTDLNPGHFLYGKKAAKSVLSGETDIVVIEDDKGGKALECVSCVEELIEKEVTADPGKRVEPAEKPVEEVVEK